MQKRKYKHIAQFGCAKCANYSGKLPANVPNFRCKKNVESFKVFRCSEFLKKEVSEHE